MAAATVAPDLLQVLSETKEELVEVEKQSMFSRPHVNGSNGAPGGNDVRSYGNNEVRWRKDFAKAYGGNGELKTKKVRQL